ncbi:putative EMP1-like protein, partial [Plasmodium gaboni]
LSSESEYEEVDINDIYPYKSPKYKTLIEVVLKPSTNNNVQDTYTDDVKYNSDTPTNKLTDNEWNRLKQNFISQYLNNIGPDVQLNNALQSYNIPKHIQPDIIHNNMEEKPFITSIQDRKLYSDDGDIVSYNIDWNIPENINRTINIMNDPKYVSSNDQYTGIDLINDSLNNYEHIDIYDELLKRKENEIFGTKHPKNTTTNSVVKETYSDPILNQLDLFHKWLDRHRDMCNQWNNKEDILSKLKDEWNNENKEHLLYTSSTHDDINTINNEHVLYTSTIDDINKINDEKYNMINANTQINHEGNDKTTLEHLGSTNISPNDLTTTNTNVQTKNLRTNISMDIHFDENNNNVLTTDVKRKENHLENSYNF